AALAAAAPESVLVAPSFADDGVGAGARSSVLETRSSVLGPRSSVGAVGASVPTGSAMAAGASGLEGRAGAAELRRIDTPAMRIADDAQTPDEMFLSIAAAASRSRMPAAAAPAS